MKPDRFDRALRDLGEHLSSNVQAPPYEVIERRRTGRRRRREVGALLGVVVLVTAAVVGTTSAISGRSGAPVSARPQVTVTETVPAAVEGRLTLRDVSYLTDQVNAVLGQRCDLTGRCDTVVLRSDDGGRTFGHEHVVTRVGVVGPTKIALGAGQTLVAYDPGLYLSQDGGVSWQVLTPPGYAIKDVSTRGKTFTALGVSIDGQAALLQVPVADLAGGLRTYIPVPGADASARLQQDADGAALVTVGAVAGGGSAKILVRASGGSTWSTVVAPAACTAASFSAPTPASWWLVCVQPPAPGGDRAKTAYVSVDRGASWELVTAPPVDGGAAVVTAVGSREAYLSGPNSPLYVTTDGGTSWSVALPRVPAGFGEPHVLSGRTWVVSGSTLWRMDPGSGWVSMTLG